MTSFEKDGIGIAVADDSVDNRPLYRRAIDRLNESRLTISATLGIVAVNLLCGDSDLAVRSSDPLARQFEMAIPSAFGTPEATGVKVLDFGGVTALTASTLEAARRTTTVPELAVTAVGAQMAGCGADALVSKTDFITGDTLDVGSSAIAVAWATKFMLDKSASAEDETKRRRWRLGAAAFAGTMTLGAYAFLGGDDGKLDLISHTSALAVGAAAYRFGSWRKQHLGENVAIEK